MTEDPSAPRRWIVHVAGPWVNHLVEEYEATSEAKEAAGQTSHHKQTPGAQRDFFVKVKMLSHALKDLGNPFQEESQDLLPLDKKILQTSVQVH